MVGHAMRLVLDTRSASFGALLDDASLLGPTPPTISEAVSTYRSARTSTASWMVGRFLCPTSRLAELAESLMRSFEAGDDPWEISAVFDQGPGASASAAQAFHTEMQPAAIIAAAEARIGDDELWDIGATIDAITSIQPEIVPFLELDRASPLGDQVALVASELSRRSRIGGVQIGTSTDSGSSSLSIHDVATFIMETTTRQLPFRISEGLHGPIGCHDEERDVQHHGFVNVLVAAAAAGQGHALDTVATIIDETDPEAFSMGAAFISWRDVSIPGPTMRRVRANGFVAFGSQDFSSTVDALHALGFIGEGS